MSIDSLLPSRGLVPPNNGTRPRQGVDPSQFDYKTPIFYYSEGRTMPPYQHIFEGHVQPNPNAGPFDTFYVAGNPFHLAGCV